MKPEIKQLWIEALKSGRYKQGKGALRSINGYCCLGVLADLYVRDWTNNNKTRWSPKQPVWTHQHELVDSGGARFSAMLPTTEAFKTWSGNLDPEVQHLLAMFNDDDMGFVRIANWIEEHL